MEEAIFTPCSDNVAKPQTRTSLKCFASLANGSETGSGGGASGGAPSGTGGRLPMDGAWTPHTITVAGASSGSNVTCAATKDDT